MSKVYLLGRRERSGEWLGAFIVIAVYANKKEAQKVADQKNKRSFYFVYSVKSKSVKPHAVATMDVEFA